MKERKALTALILGLIWGSLVAWFLEYTRVGRWLASSRTWIAVTVGVGGNVLIARLLLPLGAWSNLLAIFVVSSLPVVARSLHNEARTEQELWNDLKK